MCTNISFIIILTQNGICVSRITENGLGKNPSQRGARQLRAQCRKVNENTKSVCAIRNDGN